MATVFDVLQASHPSAVPAITKYQARLRKREMDRVRSAAKRHRAAVNREWARQVGTIGGKLIRPIRTPKQPDLVLIVRVVPVAFGIREAR